VKKKTKFGLELCSIDQVTIIASTNIIAMCEVGPLALPDVIFIKPSYSNSRQKRHVRREKPVTDQLAPVFIWLNRVVK
jgi:hypothetical protein